MITNNPRAYHDYFIEDKFEAGLVLQGWEAKAIRAGKVSIKEAYVMSRDNEVFVIGMHITPLKSASTHENHDTTRTRKLLLNKREIEKILGKTTVSGYTVIPLNLHYSKGKIKIEIGLAKGKKQYDKRETEKQKDWNRDKERLLKNK